MMSNNNVINLEKVREDRRLCDELPEVFDTHDTVLDISNVVFTAEDLDCDTTVTDDYIIINTQPKGTEET